MRINRLLPVSCLLGFAACTDAEILGPAPAAVEGAQRSAQAAGQSETPLPQVSEENCIRIVVVQLDAQGRPVAPRVPAP
jgi:hypothetical protein